MTCFSVGRINYRRKGASWRERRGEGGADVTSDARFLSRIGRRLRFSLSLFSLSLSLRSEGFFLLEIGRSCSKRGLKNIPPPENSRFVRASTLNVLVPMREHRRCPSRESPLLFRFAFTFSRGKVGKRRNKTLPVLIHTSK